MSVINEDLGICDRCGKDVHLPHDPPCPHGICVCDTCDPAEVCDDCHAQAVEDFLVGSYSESADPLVVAPVESEADYLTRTRLNTFDTTTNSYRRQA